MNKITYIILLLIGYDAIAQNYTAIIKGTVLATNNNEPVKNALISLKSGGISLSQQTDNAGNNEFKFEADNSTLLNPS